MTGPGLSRACSQRGGQHSAGTLGHSYSPVEQPPAVHMPSRRPIRSQVIWELISGFRGETTSQVVVPTRDPPAKVCGLRLIKLVCGEVFVREDADSSKVVQDRLEVEVRFVTAGKTLKIDVGEGAGDCVQVDDVADNEPVMPGTGLQPHSVLKRQCPYVRHGSYLDGDEARIERLLQQIHLQCLSGTREPQRQASVTTGRFHQFHVISRGLEG